MGDRLPSRSANPA